MEEALQTEIITRAKRGDQTATHQLYTETRDFAYFAAKSYLKNEKDIAAVLQDSYIMAIGRLEDYNLLEPFKKWLHGIIAVKSVNLLRSKKVKFATKDEVGDPPMSAELVPAAWVDQEDRRWGVMRIVEGLPDGQRLALVMYFLGEMTLSEIADALGVSAGEARTHLYNARQAVAINVPPGADTSNPSPNASPLMAQLMNREAERTAMPPEMAKSVYQNVMMFFMTGGKVPRLDSKKAAKSAPESSGGFLLRILPVAIMVLVVAILMVAYVINYNRNQRKVAEQLVAEYHQSKDEALAKGDDWPGVTTGSAEDGETGGESPDAGDDGVEAPDGQELDSDPPPTEE